MSRCTRSKPQATKRRYRLQARHIIACLIIWILWYMAETIPRLHFKQKQLDDQRAGHSPAQQPAGQSVTVTEEYVPVINSTKYTDAVREVASDDNMVMLTLVDEGYVEMAINFYLTCIQPHGIKNYLVLTTHPDTCKKLYRYRIKCFQYLSGIRGNNVSSKFGSKEFIKKMDVRTNMIVEALQIGVSVLHTDIDVTFMRNPLEHINCSRSECDMAVLVDRKMFNAGFLMIHPSSLSVYKDMQKIARKKRNRFNDQEQLNKVVVRHKQLKLVKLPVSMFVCGKLYYEYGKRFYADTMSACPKCVVVHNNWIVSKEAKVYRAKEVHQWMYDGDEYYSSTARKYMTYVNGPKPYSISQETATLQVALAIAEHLNRILILPKFYCNDQMECPINSFLIIRRFDACFSRKYREHSFLTHSLVPECVKSSVFVANQTIHDKGHLALWNRFSQVEEYVLRFQFLPTNISFEDPQSHKQFNKTNTQCFVNGTYLNK